MNRRGFISRVLGALVAAPLAELIPVENIILAYKSSAARLHVWDGSTVGNISTATYKFWRNQTADGSCARPLTAEDLRKVWNACE